MNIVRKGQIRRLSKSDIANQAKSIEHMLGVAA
jgi:hypothetical protein